jgi:hypothetical protein
VQIDSSKLSNSSHPIVRDQIPMRPEPVGKSQSFTNLKVASSTHRYHTYNPTGCITQSDADAVPYRPVLELASRAAIAGTIE